MDYHMRFAQSLTDLMDSKFSFMGVRFGIDPLLNLIPFAGDAVGALLSFYLVWIAYRLHVPKEKINEMIGNIIFDFIIGLIPLLGEIGDLLYRANTKNMKILRQYYGMVAEGEIISENALQPAIYRR